MSRYDWERGEILLPTAAVPTLKKTLRDAANAYHDAVLAECVRLWTGPLARTSSQKLYEERLERAARDLPDQLSEAVMSVMYGIVGGSSRWRRAESGPAPRPRMPRAADVEQVAPRASVRSVSFGGGEEWRIVIDGHKLVYHSGDNNHQVERARSHPVVWRMFKALGAIDWTRGSGGVFYGNDEYHRESGGPGGGGNYITSSFGPRGEAEQAFAMGISLERYRAMMAKSKADLARRPSWW